MNYSEMSDEEMDRVIAERLGYYARVAEPEEFPRGFYHDGQNEGHWYVYRADGLQINVWGKASAEDAWKDAMRPDPECGGYRYDLKMWSRSVDAALTLIPDGAYWSVGPTIYNTSLYEAQINNMCHSCYTTPARAICIAWLHWRDSAGGGG